MPLNKADAAAAAIAAGEPFEVTLLPDDQPRVVTVPEDLATALDEAGLRDRSARLSFTRQRETAEAIEGAKRTETRQRRIQQAVDQLSR